MATAIEKKQIQNLIRKTIVESVRDLVSDPDVGRTLAPYVARRIKKYSRSKTRKGVSLAELKKRGS